MLLTIAMFTGTSELHNRYLLALFFLLQLYLSYKTNFKASPLWCISHSSVIIPEIELTPFCFILPQYPINSNLFFSTLHHQRRSTFYSCVSSPVQFSSVQSLSHVRIFATPWTATGQASLSIINSRNLPKLMSIESAKTSNHLILYRPLLLLPSIPPSIRVFSNESTLCRRWPKYWSFSFSISPSNEHPGLISFTMDWLDLLAVFCCCCC